MMYNSKKERLETLKSEIDSLLKDSEEDSYDSGFSIGFIRGSNYVRETESSMSNVNFWFGLFLGVILGVFLLWVAAIKG